MSEFENERVRGLPGPLPNGERVLWRGAPDWRALAWRAFHVRDALAWFALVGVARVVGDLAEGMRLSDALAGHAMLLPVAGLAIGLLALLAKLSARTTVYTLTDKRIVMRIGIALPLTLNIPHAKISDASLRLHARGTGDLGVGFADGTRLAWLVLWPHCRPWHLRRPEPTLRAIPDAARVADILSTALAATAQPGRFVRTTVDVAPVTPDAMPLPVGGVGAAT